MSLFPAHLSGAGQENKMFCCCCPSFSCSGLKRVPTERCSCRYGRQLSPVRRSFWLCAGDLNRYRKAPGGSHWRAGHTVISAEGARTSFTLIGCVSVCVCVRGCVGVRLCVGVCVCVEGTEERNMPFVDRNQLPWFGSLTHLWCSDARS